MLKKLFSHTAIYGIAPQLTKLANFVALPIITAKLTAVDYGVSGVLTAYTAAISVFASLGLRVVLMNSFYKSPGHYKWLWRQVYGFLSLWNLVYALILALLIYLIIPTEAIDHRWTIVVLNVLPLVFFGQTSVICSTYYQLNQKPLQIALRSAVFGVTTVALNVYFIRFLNMGYMGWFWSNFIVGMLTNLSYFYPLNYKLKIRPIFNFKWRLLRHSLKVSLPTVPHFYSGYLLNSSDRLVMNVLKINTQSIGRYNVANTLGGAMGSLSHASAQAIGPMLNKLYKSGDDLAARNLVFVLQIVFLLASFCLCIWMKEIFQFMVRNRELAKVYPLGIIIIMGYNYRPMYIGSNAKLMYAERTNVIWKVSFVAGVINVGLNLILIPIMGFEVAAYTTFVSYMYMGYSGFYFKIFKEINHANYYPQLWMLITVLATATAYWGVEFNLWIKVAITVVFGALGLLALRRFNKLLTNKVY
jgi:O-antigen/teichoic acid export membrane protein